MLPAKDIRIDIGRADAGGSFLRVTHLPSGISRLKVPPLGSASEQQELQERFLKEIEHELRQRGLFEFLR